MPKRGTKISSRYLALQKKEKNNLEWIAKAAGIIEKMFVERFSEILELSFKKFEI